MEAAFQAVAHVDNVTIDGVSYNVELSKNLLKQFQELHGPSSTPSSGSWSGKTASAVAAAAAAAAGVVGGTAAASAASPRFSHSPLAADRFQDQNDGNNDDFDNLPEERVRYASGEGDGDEPYPTSAGISPLSPRRFSGPPVPQSILDTSPRVVHVESLLIGRGVSGYGRGASRGRSGSGVASALSQMRSAAEPHHALAPSSRRGSSHPNHPYAAQDMRTYLPQGYEGQEDISNEFYDMRTASQFRRPPAPGSPSSPRFPHQQQQQQGFFRGSQGAVGPRGQVYRPKDSAPRFIPHPQQQQQQQQQQQRQQFSSGRIPIYAVLPPPPPSQRTQPGQGQGHSPGRGQGALGHGQTAFEDGYYPSLQQQQQAEAVAAGYGFFPADLDLTRDDLTFPGQGHSQGLGSFWQQEEPGQGSGQGREQFQFPYQEGYEGALFGAGGLDPLSLSFPLHSDGGIESGQEEAGAAVPGLFSAAWPAFSEGGQGAGQSSYWTDGQASDLSIDRLSASLQKQHLSEDHPSVLGLEAFGPPGGGAGTDGTYDFGSLALSSSFPQSQAQAQAQPPSDQQWSERD